jgi:hypothetical protein
MPIPRHIMDELSRKRAAEHQEAKRDTRRDIFTTALACVGWAGLGLLCLMLSFAVDELLLGRIAYWGGLLVGNGGVLFTLLAAYRRGEKRGDW